MPFGLGIWELAILFAIVGVLFGMKGVPEAARRFGLGLREMRQAVAEVDPRRMLESPPADAPGEQTQSRRSPDDAPPAS